MSEQPTGEPLAMALGAHHPSSRPPPPSLIGATLSGRYRIDRLLGEGGMGAVYEAEHTLMHKRLAIKVLHSELSRVPEVVARFEREAMASAHIDHPNVALATDFGKLEDGSFFLVLEFVEGKSLRAVIDEGRLEIGRALHILQQIAAPLVRAHGMGIVHRDLKPENVMLTLRDGDPDFVKVLDFGIAKVPVGELAAGEDPKKSGKTKLTKVGMIYGTPEYMAPEQALGGTIDGRADLYALGCMAYEMLTGARPFLADDAVGIISLHLTAKVPSMAITAPDAAIPAEVEALVGRLLAKEASARPQDAREVLHDTLAILGELVSSGRISARSVAASPSRTSFANMQIPTAPPSQRVLTEPVKVTEYAAFGINPTVIGLDVKADADGAGPRAHLTRALERVGPKGLWIGGASVAAIVLLIAIVVSRSGPSPHGKHGTPVVGDADLASESTAPSASQARSAVDKQVEAASARLAKGDATGAIAILVALESAHPERADIHRALERAYMTIGRTKDALREADLWLEREPDAVKDAELVRDVRNASVERDTAEAAFAILETRMGAIGADHLYDAVYGSFAKDYPQAADRARRALAKADVRAHASPSLAVTLGLRSASTCDAKKAFLATAAEVGDARTLAVLKPLTPTKGCGFLSARDCWPCLHDGSLSRTITAIGARTP